MWVEEGPLVVSVHQPAKETAGERSGWEVNIPKTLHVQCRQEGAEEKISKILFQKIHWTVIYSLGRPFLNTTYLLPKKNLFQPNMVQIHFPPKLQTNVKVKRRWRFLFVSNSTYLVSLEKHAWLSPSLLVTKILLL